MRFEYKSSDTHPEHDGNNAKFVFITCAYYCEFTYDYSISLILR